MMTEECKGICAVCGTIAQTRCSNCRREFYCARTHQRLDWPRHKSVCRAYQECENDYLGRHLIATRNLDADEVILSEVPLVWGPAVHTEERVCVGCGRKNAIYRCSNCSWPSCKLYCDGLIDEKRHARECKILSKAKLLPRCGYLLILRILLLRQRNPKCWKMLMKLKSHESSRGPGTKAHEEFQKVNRYFGPLLSYDSNSEKILTKICGLIDVNALETNPPEGSSAIYEIACLLEHSCIANTRHTFSLDKQGRPRINVMAAIPIKKGEHISTTYTHVLWSTRIRREHLLSTKYFTCHCERCIDSTELGSHLGTIKCPCKKGLVTSTNSLDPDADWICNVCPGALSSVEVTQLFDRLAEEVEGAMTVPVKEVLTDLLHRLTVLLHPCHQLCLTIGHSLIQLLDASDPKKVELCERMLQTIKIIDPYGVRLSIYQAIALRELSMCPNKDKMNLLFKAIDSLQHEPPNSAGDMLSNIILSEI